MSTFGSFWLGPLSPYEKASLHSFVQHGHTVVLYSYRPFDGLPAGIVQADANEILDESNVGRFITDGRPNIANFADYFRYNMFLKKQICWIDSDVMMLNSFEINTQEDFLVAEAGTNICNAILNISASSDELKRIIASCERALDRDIPYATLQGYIALAYRKKPDILKSADAYMPFHHSEFYKYLLPEYYEECERVCSKAYTIHLYNNIWDKMGYYKELLPPEGSYLHHLLSKNPIETQFKGVYPESVVRALVHGWNQRFSGEALSIGSIVKQLVPSTRRTLKRLRSQYMPF
ncbi:hypothetical protein [Bradyrhizobium sp. F1.13.3]|uniref:hypothetical protein n=1 Tax=Bradyrhizobium sp. F1.13.3 TaxID=3156351 RepID=UPI003399F4AB